MAIEGTLLNLDLNFFLNVTVAKLMGCRHTNHACYGLNNNKRNVINVMATLQYGGMPKIFAV